MLEDLKRAWPVLVTLGLTLAAVLAERIAWQALLCGLAVGWHHGWMVGEWKRKIGRGL